LVPVPLPAANQRAPAATALRPVGPIDAPEGDAADAFADDDADDDGEGDDNTGDDVMDVIKRCSNQLEAGPAARSRYWDSTVVLNLTSSADSAARSREYTRRASEKACAQRTCENRMVGSRQSLSSV